MTEINSVELLLSKAFLAQLRDDQPMLIKVLRSVRYKTHHLNILIVQLENAIKQLEERK
jgi:hypothetical protein